MRELLLLPNRGCNVEMTQVSQLVRGGKGVHKRKDSKYVTDSRKCLFPLYSPGFFYDYEQPFTDCGTSIVII